MAKAKSNRGAGLLTGLANLTEQTIEEKKINTSEFLQNDKTETMISNSIVSEPIIRTNFIESPKNIIEKKKRAPGRPRKYKAEEDTVVLGIRVLKEEARFLEEYGGKYGGKTGYVTHLIHQEMERLQIK